MFFSIRDDIVLRMYGGYQSASDLSFLTKIPNLKRFYIEWEVAVNHLEALGTLTKLKQLGLSLESLENFDILNFISRDLEELVIGPTKSKKPRLAVLSRFQKLR